MGKGCGTHHGTPFWLNKEPCGLICGCLTYLLLLFGMYATTFSIIIPWLGFSFLGIANIIAFNSCALLGCYSHYKAMTTNPGAVPQQAVPLDDDMQERDEEANRKKAYRFVKFCRRCNAFKPNRAHHCSICGRCIMKMDHHCPWVNNCVGVGNHKLFMLFCFYVFATCTYSLLLTAGKIISCVMTEEGGCHLLAPHGEGALSLGAVFLFIEGVLFGLFTCCMLGDQMTSIWSNQTAIDRLKNVKYKGQSEVNEVCGTPNSVRCSWDWFLPVEAFFGENNSSLFKGVFGYQLLDGDHESEPLLASGKSTASASSPTTAPKSLTYISSAVQRRSDALQRPPEEEAADDSDAEGDRSGVGDDTAATDSSQRQGESGGAGAGEGRRMSRGGPGAGVGSFNTAERTTYRDMAQYTDDRGIGAGAPSPARKDSGDDEATAGTVVSSVGSGGGSGGDSSGRDTGRRYGKSHGNSTGSGGITSVRKRG